MSFRRMPFQFSTTDPVERQRELERRFGLSSSRNMFVDVANPLSAGSGISSSSPRLQHRVPIFVEGYDQPIHSSVDSTGITPENKKPNVRVIPIEVEGAETRSSTTRHRTFSGPAGVSKEQNDGHLPRTNETSSVKHSMVDLSQPSMTKSSTLPRVHNIPIKVESAHNLRSPKHEKVTKSAKVNGCAVAKSTVKSPEKNLKRKPEPPKVPAKAEKQESAVESALKKIENVLEELKSYESGVKEFCGNTKDKQYRYLDEMLTRCMLKVDEIDTMGNDGLRSARKNAVKKIQACIDLLESKANTVSEATSGPQNDTEMEEGQAAEQEGSKSLENDELVENCDTSRNNVEFQKNDVEMTEDQGIKSDLSDDKQIVPDVLPQEDSTNTCEVETVEKPSAELSSQMPEVEMAEIKRALSSQNLSSQFPEVEMTDSTSVQSTISNNTIPLKEEKVAEAENFEPISDVSQEDIEMKDVQSTLNDIKETVVENKYVKCNSSPLQGNTESGMNSEVCNSIVEAGQNELSDSEIKKV